MDQGRPGAGRRRRRPWEEPRPQPTTKGSTPLHAACSGGNAEIVQFLIDHGANIHATDADGRTPLHICALCGHVGAAEVLIRAGANVNAVDHQGYTPLSLARSAQNTGFNLPE